MKSVAFALALSIPIFGCGGKTPPPSEPSASSVAPQSAPPGDVDAVAPTPLSTTNDATPDAGSPAATAVNADSGAAPADAPPGNASPVNTGPTFDMSVVEAVLKEHKDALKKTCWDKSKAEDKAYIGTVTIRLAPTGKVISAQTDGTDKAASQCIDKQVKGWKFPPPKGTASIKMPIRLHRD